MTSKNSLLAATAALALLLAPACVDPKPGDTGTTPVYVFDQATRTVKAYADANALITAGTVATADRTLSSSLLQNLGNLAWGGMTLNPTDHMLYLVSDQGTVVRISNAHTQSGAITNSQDIVSFNLGIASDHTSSYAFQQAAVDPGTGTLYAVETGTSNQTKIWAVANAASILSGATVPATFVPVASSDTGIGGFTVGGSGTLVAHFLSGASITDNLNVIQTGARLRLGSGSGFPDTSNVLIGDQTTLADANTTFASLAYDTSFNRIYLLRPYGGANSIVAFNQSQFSGGSINQAPAFSLPDTSAVANLRILAHARTKDWLVGADATSDGKGTSTLRLWKGPSLGTASSVACTLQDLQIRGIALDGSQ
jgi:hypothetical protein